MWEPLHPRLLRRTLAIAMAFAALLLPASAQAVTVPESMVGMNDWTPPTEQAMSHTGSIGVKTWRAAMFWYLIEKQQGERNWSEYDALVSAAARQDTSLLMVIASCPQWACPNNLAGPPRGGAALDAHHDFVREAVSRYGNDGTFWSDHPELPYRPVTDWQVWNEVNYSDFWKPGPNAAEYAQFLKAEAAVIRAADPRATIVLSGLTDYGEIKADAFLQSLYAQPGFKSDFDVLALHAYAHDAPAVGRLLDRFHAVAANNGDGGRRLWITEFGWATTGPNITGGLTPEEQAERLRSSYDMLIGCGSRWGLERAYWFAYRDFTPAAGEALNAGHRTGLLDLTGRPKPAFSALGEYRTGAEVDSACATSTTATAAAKPPNTRVHGKRRARSGRRARVRFSASVTGARFQCALRKVRRLQSGTVPGYPRWRSCGRNFRTAKLQSGSYVLQARALTAAGVADPTPAKHRIVVRSKRRAR